MTIELASLLGICVAYLLLLFAIAYAAEHGAIPQSWLRHPAVYVLSLGVYATSWTFYGSVGFAAEQGYQFLTIYLGVTLAFILTPVLLRPILRLCHEYQLSSVADLFAFRYRSQWVGAAVTVFMLAGTLPYLALQVRAVTESMSILTQEIAPHFIAFLFCATLTLFAILFGARHISAREKHQGLVAAIAFESLVKLTALLAVAAFALFGIFGGIGGVNDWLTHNPQALQKLYQPVHEGPWISLLVLAFAAAFLLPRQFHMSFAENLNEAALNRASWAFPLFLLLLNLGIPIILWAGQHLQLTHSADYYVLGITLQQESAWLSTLVFLGGVSAASAMVIVTSLALSSMCLNHLLLPASYPDPQVDLFRWLLWGRRMLIGVIIMLAYGFYLALEHNQGLVQLGLISFVAVAQFLPGLIGLLYWRRATRYGFLAGLVGGATVWSLTLVIPLLYQSDLIRTQVDLLPWLTRFGMDKWTFSTSASLLVNVLLYVIVSLLTRSNREEQDAALACCRESVLSLPAGLFASTPLAMIDRLGRIIGDDTARQQVEQALSDLQMSHNEQNPWQLGRLRERLERNLSGLMGPLLARLIVKQDLLSDPVEQNALAHNVRFIEQRLEASHTRLRGLAAELDQLRRYHRRILEELPLGVCALTPDNQIVMWNLSCSILTGISREQAEGKSLHQLPAPWSRFFARMVAQPDQHVHKQQLREAERARCFNVHKAVIESPQDLSMPQAGSVILLEDLTDLQTLEGELAHSERLASIGRLAAGVAHEIGNPVTGIACLAQNLRAESTDATVQQTTERILLETQRINEIVQTLMRFSHGGDEPQLSYTPVCLYYVIEDAIRLVRLSEKGKRLQWQNRVDADLHVRGDKPRLVQVLVNLLNNACDAMDLTGRVQIQATLDQTTVTLDILDEGCGIREQDREHLFEPFFTTKPVGEGTGLGLALVYSIIQAHQGSIRLEARKQGGTRARVCLPVWQPMKQHDANREGTRNE